MVFLKEFFEKVDFEKKIITRQKVINNFPAGEELTLTTAEHHKTSYCSYEELLINFYGNSDAEFRILTGTNEMLHATSYLSLQCLLMSRYWYILGKRYMYEHCNTADTMGLNFNFFYQI